MKFNDDYMTCSPLILLAEDDDRNILRFKTALNDSGIRHTLRVVTDSLQLVELISNLKPIDPDIVFINIGMSSQKGLETLSRLRFIYAETLPIFDLSVLQNPNAAENVRRLGATGFLTKPDCISKLSNLLTDILSKDWKNRCLSDFYMHIEYDPASIGKL